MAKRHTGVGRNKGLKGPHKTKKRLEVKRKMLSARANKGAHKKHR
jgi:hypothetical protein